MTLWLILRVQLPVPSTSILIEYLLLGARDLCCVILADLLFRILNP